MQAILESFINRIKQFRKEKHEKKIMTEEFSTVNEILDDILRMLSKEYQKNIKEISALEFVIDEHFNLGVYIRNKYFYQNPAREKLIESLDNPTNDYLFLNGDEFSGIILEKLHERITKIIKK